MRAALAACMLAVIPPAWGQGHVYCADEPGAALFMKTIPPRYATGIIGAPHERFEQWVTLRLGHRERLPMVARSNHLRPDSLPKPIARPAHFSAVLLVNPAGSVDAVLILAASNRAAAKVQAQQLLDWTFRPPLARETLRPGIFREAPVTALFYTTIGAAPPRQGEEYWRRK